MRKSIERYIGKLVLPPILAYLAKIVVQTAILLRHKDDVIQNPYGLTYIEGRSRGSITGHREAAFGRALAGSTPAGKISPLRRDGCQGHNRS